MKATVRLRLDVVERFGPDAAKVLDYLIDYGTVDDVLARKHLVIAALFERMMTTERGLEQIWEDVAEDFGLSFDRVRQIARGK